MESRIERRNKNNQNNQKFQTKKILGLLIALLTGIFIFEIYFQVSFGIEQDKLNSSLRLLSNNTQYIEYGNNYKYTLEKLTNINELANLKVPKSSYNYNNTVKKKQLIKQEKEKLKNEIKITTNLKNEKNKDYPAIGVYGINIKYKNKNLYKKIEVRDTTPPTIASNYERIDIVQNTDLNSYDFQSKNIFNISDLSETDIKYITNEIKSNEVGTYYLKLVAKDICNNKSTSKVQINITPQPNENQELITDTITNDNGLLIIQNSLRDKPVENSLIDTKEENNISNSISNNNSSKIEQTTIEETIKGICGKDGNVRTSVVNEVNHQLSLVPKKIMDKFQSTGWKIFVTDKSIAQSYAHSSGRIMGYTMYTEKQIVIENRTSASTEATIHEIGHFWDDYLGTVSTQSEFNQIYHNEKNQFKSAFNVREGNISSNMEYFGEAFWKYVTEKDKFKNTCPQTYNYFESKL